MLVLTRRSGEDIQIGEDITVHVVSTHKGRVVLGITAPDQLSITRPRGE